MKLPATVGWTFMSTGPEPESREIGKNIPLRFMAKNISSRLKTRNVFLLFVFELCSDPVDMNVHPTGAYIELY